MNWQRVIMPAPRARWTLLGISAALFVLSAAMGWQAMRVARETAAIEEKIQQLQADAKARSRKPTRQEIELNKKWEALAIERSFPWSKLLASVERAVDPDIELFELRTEPLARSFVISGKARTVEALQRYLGSFSNVDLAHVSLVRQVALDPDGGGQVEFEIRAVLR